MRRNAAALLCLAERRFRSAIEGSSPRRHLVGEGEEVCAKASPSSPVDPSPAPQGSFAERDPSASDVVVAQKDIGEALGGPSAPSPPARSYGRFSAQSRRTASPAISWLKP